MTSLELIIRSVRYYWRTHLGVVAAAAVTAAVLVGALLVGDSVRHTLASQARLRLGRTRLTVASADGFFTAALADSLASSLKAPTAPVLQLRGLAAGDGTRANGVQVLGVDERFWRLGPRGEVLDPGDGVILNRRLARQLDAKIGDMVLLRLEKPSLLPRDAPLAPVADSTVAFRLNVSAIASGEQFGRFGLQADQIAPYTAFVPLRWLQDKAERPGRANLLLIDGDVTAAAAKKALAEVWRLADAELAVVPAGKKGRLELRSTRVFLNADVVRAGAAEQGAVGVLSYFVNELASGDKAAPYSMVAAVGPLGDGPSPASGPLAEVMPAGMGDDEILLSDWLADDLSATVGDTVKLTYFVLGPMRRLDEKSRSFKVRAVLATDSPTIDPTLMPDFPGLSEAETCADWEPGIPIDLGRVRDKDNEYWKEHGGAPKAFVTLRAGRQMWANRFGDLTAIRWPLPKADAAAVAGRIRGRLGPESAGLAVQDVAALAGAASGQGLDFGGLFLGLSFFLIAAAVLLTALLFVFGVEQRSAQAGTLGALGWPAVKVRRVLLAEGAVLAGMGAAAGAPLGLAYTWGMLAALSTVWRGAVAGAAIRFHAQPTTVIAGAVATVLIAVVAMWVVLRRQSRTPLTVLLAGEIRPARARRRGLWAPLAVMLVCAATAAALLGAFGWGRDPNTAMVFFAAGSLLLTAMLAADRLWLNLTARAAGKARLNLRVLAMRNVTRRPGRSLAVMALLSAGSFLVVAIGAFWLDPTIDAQNRSSGTGGFALIGTSAMGVFGDLNTPAGLEDLGIPQESLGQLAGVRVVPMRVRRGDDASCLNLNRAQQPQLLGVQPGELGRREAFRFLTAAEGLSVQQGWALLDGPAGDAIPAIGDEATVRWALGKAPGQTVAYVDQRGKAFKVRIVATIANSILQGNLLIAEKAFVERFPDHSGYRMFLIDAPPGRAGQVGRLLTEAGTDVGLEVTPAVDRLAEFNQVQNTYLSIFQALGGLGLILGSVGLGVVVMRNVLERRGQLALMQAVGYSRSDLHRLVLWEHCALLLVGLAGGVIAAIVAVWPALQSAGTEAPYALLGAILAGVVASGLVWTVAATSAAIRGPLLGALRSE